MDEINRNREPYYDEYEIDLRELIIFVWNRKWFIVAMFFIAIIAAFVISKFYMSPVYETEATIQLSNTGGLYSQPATAKQILKNSSKIINILEQNSKQEVTSAKLNSFINNNISIENISDTQIMNIKVKSGRPESAQAIVQAMIDSYRTTALDYYNKFINNKQDYLKNLEKEIEQTNKNIEDTTQHINRLENLDIDSADKSILINSQISKLDFLQQHQNNLITQKHNVESKLLEYYPFAVFNSPYIPENSVSPNTRLNMAIAGVLALMLGIFIIFFKKMMTETDDKK